MGVVAGAAAAGGAHKAWKTAASGSLAIGFAELLGAVILGVAAVTGSSLGSVVRGQPDRTKTSAAPSSSPGAAPSSSPGAGTSAGTAQFEGHTVAAWIVPVLTYARAHGWTGQVTSGYRSYDQQKSIYDSGVRPAAVPGTSNHEETEFPGGAVDVTNASQLSAIIKASPFASLLVWAGSKDPVHFSHPSSNGTY